MNALIQILSEQFDSKITFSTKGLKKGCVVITAYITDPHTKKGQESRYNGYGSTFDTSFHDLLLQLLQDYDIDMDEVYGAEIPFAAGSSLKRKKRVKAIGTEPESVDRTATS